MAGLAPVLRMARGIESPLRPRAPREDIAERLELHEAALGLELECAVGAHGEPVSSDGRPRHVAAEQMTMDRELRRS